MYMPTYVCQAGSMPMYVHTLLSVPAPHCGFILPHLSDLYFIMLCCSILCGRIFLILYNITFALHYITVHYITPHHITFHSTTSKQHGPTYKKKNSKNTHNQKQQKQQYILLYQGLDHNQPQWGHCQL